MTFPFLVAACLFGAVETVSLPVMRESACDVLVVGGGPAGLSAAVCAARHGAKTILAERNGYLGGMATAGLVGPFMTATTPKGEMQLIRGFFDEFVRAMEAKGGAIHPSMAKIGSFSSYRAGGHYGMTTFDPETFKSVAEKMCRKAGVELLYHLLFVKAEVADGRISAAYFATKGGIWKIVAKNYVDCTGDGDVAFSAGVPMVYGDGAGDVQASSLFFRIRGVDRAKMDAHDAECRARNDADSRFYVNEIKAARAAGEFPIWRNKVEVYEGLDGTWIVNMGQSEDVDGRDPKQVTDAEIAGREQARIIVAFLRKYVKGCENCELAFSADQLGVRETRRIVGEYTVTVEDVKNSVRFPDSVFCCANHMDIHRKGRVEYVTRKTDAPYFIQYRALLPRGVGNLLVAGRCAAAERPVMAAIRVMPPCFAMGQAAGTAAAMSVKAGVGPKELDSAALVSAYLTGRYVEICMTPFSFAEFIEAAGPVFPAEDKAQLFNRYLMTGGVPFLAKLKYDQDACHAYLQDLYGAILLKDVVRRKQIRDVDLLDRIVRFVMAECGHAFSARRIVDFLKSERRDTSVETVLNYLSACEEAFLIARVPRQDLVGKRILSVDEKFYVTDIGIRNTVVRGSLRRDVDQLLENIVYFEFLRRGYEVCIGRLKEREVDFVCDKGTERLYVQVSFVLGNEETRQREYSVLEDVRSADGKLLLTMDRLDMSDGTIRHMYIPDFLAPQSWKSC